LKVVELKQKDKAMVLNNKKALHFCEALSEPYFILASIKWSLETKTSSSELIGLVYH
jgi:hypothetical protein